MKAVCGVTCLPLLSLTSVLLAALPGHAIAQDAVAIATVGGDTLPAQLYGRGQRGVVLVAHGGYSTNVTWQAQAQAIADAGFRVLVVETRGAVKLRAGQETECLYDPACMAADVLSAVRYLRNAGIRSITLIGGSAGGGAAAQASVEAAPGEIDRLILLAPMAIARPDQMKGAKLFITSREDRDEAGPRLPGIREQYAKAPKPKRLLILTGSAHGQRVFADQEGPRLMHEILRFLRTP